MSGTREEEIETHPQWYKRLTTGRKSSPGGSAWSQGNRPEHLSSTCPSNADSELYPPARPFKGEVTETGRKPSKKPSLWQLPRRGRSSKSEIDQKKSVADTSAHAPRGSFGDPTCQPWSEHPGVVGREEDNLAGHPGTKDASARRKPPIRPSLTKGRSMVSLAEVSSRGESRSRSAWDSETDLSLRKNGGSSSMSWHSRSTPGPSTTSSLPSSTIITPSPSFIDLQEHGGFPWNRRSELDDGLFAEHPSMSPVPPFSASSDGATSSWRTLPAKKRLAKYFTEEDMTEAFNSPLSSASPRRIVVFGMHGFYPRPITQKIFGQPRRSAYFADLMGRAVGRYLSEARPPPMFDPNSVTFITFDGEGTVENRVIRHLTQYLGRPDWVDALSRADAIFFAAHSQGCIVATHLLHRLIAIGHIDTERTKVLLLAMCGVHLGPAVMSSALKPIMRSYLKFESEAAKELYAFQDTSSPASRAYHSSLDFILDHQVRVVLTASLTDQMCILPSAHHPRLHRNIFMDETQTAVSPVVSLLGLSTDMRNAGFADSELEFHLSSAVIGAWHGTGHSDVYEEIQPYMYAVRHLFESPNSPIHVPLDIGPFQASASVNEYQIPFILGGLLEAAQTQTLFRDRFWTIREDIAQWRPDGKNQRFLRKKLEPMALMQVPTARTE